MEVHSSPDLQFGHVDLEHHGLLVSVRPGERQLTWTFLRVFFQQYIIQPLLWTNVTTSYIPSFQFDNSKYRSGTVNSKSFVGKVLLRIKWKFELINAL